jgi:hypothetical protein
MNFLMQTCLGTWAASSYLHTHIHTHTHTHTHTPSSPRANKARLTILLQTVISLELLTVLVAGPLACAICYGIAKKDPRTSVLMIIVATMELYGGFLTFCPEWLTHNYNLDTSNFMYKWVYLVFFNMLWVFIPFWSIWVAAKDINDAFAVRSRAQTASKSK